METSREILTMREMAWCRAQGELQALLASYWPEWDNKNNNLSGYETAKEIIEEFVKKFNKNCR